MNITFLVEIDFDIIFFTEVMVLSLYCILYGIILIVLKKHDGIICGWVTVLLVLLSLRKVVGAGYYALFACLIHPGLSKIALMVYIFWILVIIMTIVTIVTLKKKNK